MGRNIIFFPEQNQLDLKKWKHLLSRDGGKYIILHFNVADISVHLKPMEDDGELLAWIDRNQRC